MSHILHINTTDIVGGAALWAHQLHKGCLKRSLPSRMVVGFQYGKDPKVSVINHDSEKSFYARTVLRFAHAIQSLPVKGAWKLHKALEFAAEPSRNFATFRGFEDFHFPGSWRLLNGNKPAIVHCHNLHGGYFDLNALPWLSQKVPVIVTLHDSWLLSGHCGYSLDCERWKSGCGDCPYLSTYPAVRRDKTAENWKRKESIYKKSRLYVATPSQWLMNLVKDSMLAKSVVGSRVIHNGVDLSIFYPGDKDEARNRIGITGYSKVLLYVGNKLQSNIYKDYATLRSAFEIVAHRHPDEKLALIVLGEESPTDFVNQSEIRFVPYHTDLKEIASYYHASDLYVHSARADTFPTTILEALACGLPVVATAIGGIPEQVKTSENPSGILVPPQDPKEMATAIERILFNENLRQELGKNASRDASERFNLEVQVQQYLDWYNEIANLPIRPV